MLPAAVALITCLWLHSQQQVFHLLLDDVVWRQTGRKQANYNFEIWKTVQVPTAFCCREIICWGDRLKDKGVPALERSWQKAELKAADKAHWSAGWIGKCEADHAPGGTAIFSVWRAVEISFENVCTWTEKTWKKGLFISVFNTCTFFNHTRVCFKAQPTSSALPCSPTHSRDTSFSHHDLCR